MGIVVDILNGEGMVMHSTNAKLASSANDQMTAVYEYSVWANLGEKLTFLPTDPRYFLIHLCQTISIIEILKGIYDHLLSLKKTY